MPEIDTCPQAIHTSYYDRDVAEAVARSRRSSGVVCTVITCRTCGNYRLVRVA
jgi:hypothetical protein